MPVVDLSTGKIYGCEKGTRSYYHEKGHLYFNSKEFGVKINYYGSFFKMIAVFFVAVGVLTDSILVKSFGFVNAAGMMVCYIIEEAYCEIYAWRKMKRKRK